MKNKKMLFRRGLDSFEDDDQTEDEMIQQLQRVARERKRKREQDEDDEKKIQISEIIRQWLAYRRPPRFLPDNSCDERCPFEPINNLPRYYGCTMHGRIHVCDGIKPNCHIEYRRGNNVCMLTGEVQGVPILNSYEDHQNGDYGRPVRRRGRGARTSSGRIRHLADSGSKIESMLEDLFQHQENRLAALKYMVQKASETAARNVAEVCISRANESPDQRYAMMPVYTELIAAGQSAYQHLAIFGVPRDPSVPIPEECAEVPEFSEWKNKLVKAVHIIWSFMEEKGMSKRNECLQEVMIFILYAWKTDGMFVIDGIKFEGNFPILQYLPTMDALNLMQSNLCKRNFNATFYRRGRRVITEKLVQIAHSCRDDLKRISGEIVQILNSE